MIRWLAPYGADLNESEEGIPAIDQAAIQGHRACVEQLAGLGAELTAVSLAAQGHVGKLMSLLEDDAKLLHRQTPNRQYTLLHIAAIHDQPGVAQALTSAGADVNRGDRSNFTPSHAAARHGNPTVAKLLLLRGAKVNARSNGGMYGFGLATPLHVAVQPFRRITAGHVEVAALLIAHGADPTVKGEAYTALTLTQRGTP